MLPDRAQARDVEKALAVGEAQLNPLLVGPQVAATPTAVVRWRQAVELEKEHRVVLCDSDPLKLRYSWCLARVEAAPWSRFRHELRYVRQAFASAQLGLSDLVLVSMPPLHVLRNHKATDMTRQRRSFDLHVTTRRSGVRTSQDLYRNPGGRASGYRLRARTCRASPPSFCSTTSCHIHDCSARPILAERPAADRRAPARGG